MRAVLVGIGKNNNFIIIKIVEIEIVSDSRSERAYYRSYFFVFENLRYALLFGVKRLTSERKDSLMLSVPALLRATACGIALDNEHLVEFGFFARTRSEFTDKFCRIRAVFRSCDFFGVSCRVSRFRRADRLFNHGVEYRLVFLVSHKDVKFFDCRRFDRRFRFRVTEFGLGLPLELDVFHLDRNYSRHTFAEIFSGENDVLILDEIVRFCVIVKNSRDARFKANFMSPAFRRGNVVYE